MPRAHWQTGTYIGRLVGAGEAPLEGVTNPPAINGNALSGIPPTARRHQRLTPEEKYPTHRGVDATTALPPPPGRVTNPPLPGVGAISRLVVLYHAADGTSDVRCWPPDDY